MLHVAPKDNCKTNPNTIHKAKNCSCVCEAFAQKQLSNTSSNTNLGSGVVNRRLSVHVGKVKDVVNAEANDHYAGNGLDNAEIPILCPLAKA